MDDFKEKGNHIFEKGFLLHLQHLFSVLMDFKDEGGKGERVVLRNYFENEEKFINYVIKTEDVIEFESDEYEQLLFNSILKPNKEVVFSWINNQSPNFS